MATRNHTPPTEADIPPVTGRPPTAEDIRAHLLNRAYRYAVAAGLTLTAVSRLCTTGKDGRFLPEVAEGQGFTVERYQKAMDWFAANRPPRRRDKAAGT
jgi:hypothetical protein